MDNAPDGLPRRVLLWLDPEMQFSRIVPFLKPILLSRDIHVLQIDLDSGIGQLALKLALDDIETEERNRAIVYLPGHGRSALDVMLDGSAPSLWGVFDYRFRGCIWGRGDTWEAGSLPEPPTLLGWLRRHGVTTTGGRVGQSLSAGGSDSLISRYTEAMRETNPRDWPRPLRKSDVIDALAGEPHATLRRLLAAPNNEVRQWGENRSLVLQKISHEYGLNGIDAADSPEEMADTFVLSLALCEAWEAFGHPDDFPYLSRLPNKIEHRQRQCEFLRQDVLPHNELRPRFLERIQKLEQPYDLSAWASGRSGQPVGLPRLARIRWNQFLHRFDEVRAGGWSTAIDYLLSNQSEIGAASKAWLNVDLRWDLLQELCRLAEQSKQAVSQAEVMQDARSMVDAFTNRWWQIDRLHLSIRAGSQRSLNMEGVRQVADLAYFDYVRRVNDQFSNLVENKPGWPPHGTSSVDQCRDVIWKLKSSRSAVVMSDACRWDLAMTLADSLDQTPIVKPVLSTLPSVTPFGMSALLPLGDEKVSVSFLSGKLSIRAENVELSTRDGRKAFLRQALQRDHSNAVEFIDMDDLLQGAKVPSSQIVVVFDNTIDEQGEMVTQELPGLIEKFTNDIRHTIDRLHESGIPTVHLVTDHGFLLLPSDAIDNLGRPELAVTQAYYRGSRYAILKPDVATVDLYRKAMPLDPTQTLGFPRGVRTLVKATDYLHGGISLQECVIPHLISEIAIAPTRVGVEATVTTPTLTGGTVPVVVRPIQREKQQTLGGLQPITVRIWVESSDGTQVAEPVELVVRPDAEELRPAVYLKEGLGLKSDQTLRLRVIDSETGEDLGSTSMTLLVDWE